MAKEDSKEYGRALEKQIAGDSGKKRKRKAATNQEIRELFGAPARR